MNDQAVVIEVNNYCNDGDEISALPAGNPSRLQFMMAKQRNVGSDPCPVSWILFVHQLKLDLR